MACDMHSFKELEIHYFWFFPLVCISSQTFIKSPSPLSFLTSSLPLPPSFLHCTQFPSSLPLLLPASLSLSSRQHQSTTSCDRIAESAQAPATFQAQCICTHRQSIPCSPSQFPHPSQMQCDSAAAAFVCTHHRTDFLFQGPRPPPDR